LDVSSWNGFCYVLSFWCLVLSFCHCFILGSHPPPPHRHTLHLSGTKVTPIWPKKDYAHLIAASSSSIFASTCLILPAEGKRDAEPEGVIGRGSATCWHPYPRH
jgi:hypothetical protein